MNTPHHRTTRARLAAAVLIATASAPALALQTFADAGATPADIQGTVDSFRALLGANNGNAAGSGSGRREINWDGAPDAASDPAFMSPTLFRNNRGATLTTPGSGVKLGADSSNPTNTPATFGVAEFATFSAERLFAPFESTVTLAQFTVPGSPGTAATVSAFGAVFTGVDTAGSSWIAAYDAQGAWLGSAYAPVGRLSFAALRVDAGLAIAEVRIHSGTQALGTLAAQVGGDLVALDDFIYAEPLAAVPEPATALLLALGVAGLAWRRRTA